MTGFTSPGPCYVPQDVSFTASPFNNGTEMYFAISGGTQYNGFFSGEGHIQ
jgi:hypothetical protein